jgi:hypothetical protein
VSAAWKITIAAAARRQRRCSSVMKRRDFLMFRTEGRTKTVELSCERLYMLYVDTRNRPGPEPADEYEGEPPARFALRTARQLFDDLARDLRDADVLRVTHTEWLAEEEFTREVTALAEAVRARGGRVEMS